MSLPVVGDFVLNLQNTCNIHLCVSYYNKSTASALCPDISLAASQNIQFNLSRIFGFSLLMESVFSMLGLLHIFKCSHVATAYRENPETKSQSKLQITEIANWKKKNEKLEQDPTNHNLTFKAKSPLPLHTHTHSYTTAMNKKNKIKKNTC